MLYVFPDSVIMGAGPVARQRRHDRCAVALAAVDAPGAAGDPRAVEPLIEKLQDRDDDFYIRKKAARTLYVIYKQGRLDKGQEDRVLAHWHS